MRNFMGDKFFLSNFYQLPNPIKDPIDNDILYWTAEHAFQAMKTNDIGERKKIAQATSPAKARWLGRSIYLRNDWEEIKVNTMRWIVKSKFQQNPDLANRLLGVEDTDLIEYNTWCDNFWGVCTCPKCKNKAGQNLLGRILLEMKNHLQHK